jgi:hypothetical protein
LVTNLPQVSPFAANQIDLLSSDNGKSKDVDDLVPERQTTQALQPIFTLLLLLITYDEQTLMIRISL